MEDEKGLQQFFQDIEFMPPNERDSREFIAVDDGVDDGVFAGIEGEHEDHPNPQMYSDYYMFTDPGAEQLAPVASSMATQNRDYTPKDMNSTHSFSDVHSESLEQEVSEFPIHTGVRSMGDPSEIFNMNIAKNVVLEKPTYIEGKIYDKGTYIQWKESK